MDTEVLSKLLIYLPTFLLLLPIGISLYRYAYLGKGPKVFAITLYIGFPFALLNLLSLQVLANNRFMLYIYVAMDVLCLVWFFQTVIRNADIRKIIFFAAGIFLTYEVIDAFYITGYRNLNSYCLAANALFVLGLVAYYFYELLTNISVSTLAGYPLLWIALGILVNTLATLLNIFGGKLLDSSVVAYKQLNNVIYMAGIGAYLLYSVGFWQSKKT